MNELTRRFRLPLIILPLIVIVICCFYWFNQETTILLVRHAEKAAVPGADPPLSCTGQLRAQQLINVAGDAGVAAIYTSQYTRTQQTAQPLANHLGINTTVLTFTTTAQQYAEDLVDELISQHAGEVVLVVNHSNTIPLIVSELGAGPIAAITEQDYDNLFIVTVPRFFDNIRIIRAKFNYEGNCP